MTIEFTGTLVTIATTEVEKIVTFYTQILGQKPTTNIPNIYAEFHINGLRLGIFKPKANHNCEFQNSSQSKMSLCLEVNNLENAVAYLTALGYPPPGEIAIASHGREIYAYDPDGNRIILHQSTTLSY